MQPMSLGQPQLLPGQPHQMMPGGLQQPMQPPQQQFMQPLGQIPPQSQLGQGPNQMQSFLQQQQLQQQFQQPVPGPNMHQVKALLQQPPIQQMQGFNQNMAQQKMMQTSHLTNMLLGQGSQQASAPAWSIQNQNQSQAPMDILGLADKAAQALSGRIPQVTQVNMSNPNFPPPPAPAPAQSFQQQQTMVTEKGLPMMVQYAVQNLRTTGHIEQTLDGNLVNMLNRLPETAALQALEIFSSCDLSKMRNRSSYLAGILKKELIKLGL